jgi:AcrR family transcriptional regulator
MDMKSKILTSSEAAFDRHGFTATGMDRLAELAQISSRTLYKHAGSKTSLITSILDRRSVRFFETINAHDIDGLFSSLIRWTVEEGSRGCLFLRALSDVGDEPLVHDAVSRYRNQLHALIFRLTAKEVGLDSCEVLAEQILIIFEGATAAASYRGPICIAAAQAAAKSLIDQARVDRK